MYTITQGLAEANSIEATGKISFLGTPIYILIDYSAIKCFLANSLVERLEVN